MPRTVYALVVDSPETNNTIANELGETVARIVSDHIGQLDVQITVTETATHQLRPRLRMEAAGA